MLGVAGVLQTIFPSRRVAHAPVRGVFLSWQWPLHLVASLPWSLVQSGDSVLFHVTVWVGICAQARRVIMRGDTHQKGFALTSALAVPFFIDLCSPRATTVSLSGTVSRRPRFLALLATLSPIHSSSSQLPFYFKRRASRC